MRLGDTDAKTFFTVWAHIDAFTAQKTGLVAGINGQADVAAVPAQTLQRIREALWKRRSLLDDFVAANPFRLAPPELELALGFKHAICGRFFVERCLKQHAILVGAQDRRVYAVLGLTEDIGEFLYHRSPVGLAAMVETTLLPFKGRIVWDGLVALLRVAFGPGIRSGFKEAYMRAKDRGEIVTTLGDGRASRSTTAKRPMPSAIPALDKVVAAVGAVGRPAGPLQAAAFRLMEAGAITARVSANTPTDLDEIRRVQRSLNALIRAVQRQSGEY